MSLSDSDADWGTPLPGWPDVGWQDDGVFETMRVVGARPIALDAHLARCLTSCAALGLSIAPARLERAAHAALARYEPQSAESVLRVVVMGGARPTDARCIWAWCAPLPDETVARRDGVHAARVQATRWVLSAHKTTRAMERRRAHPQAAPLEPLYVDDAGSALEGATWSLFARFGDHLVTPPLDGRILPGVTRARALAAAQDLGVAAVEAPLEAWALLHADEVFVTNALLPIAPLVSLDARPLSTDRTLSDALRARLTPT